MNEAHPAKDSHDSPSRRWPPELPDPAWQNERQPASFMARALLVWMSRAGIAVCGGRPASFMARALLVWGLVTLGLVLMHETLHESAFTVAVVSLGFGPLILVPLILSQRQE